MSIEEIKAKCQKEIKGGKSHDEIIELLHDSGLTITESMKVVMELFKISLGEAKIVVAGHPVWSNVVEAAKPLHNDLITKMG